MGLLVLLLNSKKESNKGLKLEHNWLGPYIIREAFPKGTYHLHNPQNANGLAQKFNMRWLKLYNECKCSP